MGQPLIEPATGRWTEHGGELRYAPATGIRVLVVEDEHLVALDIQLRLVRMGFAAEVAFSGSEAIRKASQQNFDLVVMDIKLRGTMDGIEAAKIIHSEHEVPVIYLTAYADTATVERARQTEPYGYLLKPFQDRELKVTIDIALQRHLSDRLRAEQQHLQRFLSEASARLAESLDYRAVASAIGDLLVPRYADWCLLHLREAEDGLPGFAYTRPGPSEVTERQPEVHRISDVERHRETRILEQLEHAEDACDLVGAEYGEMMRAIGARSIMSVPLVARDVVLGSLTLVAGTNRPRFGSRALAMIEDVAHRLAMALDNALLYRRAQRALRLRDDVLAIVSHDLRGPLSTIMLRAKSLERRANVARIGTSILRVAERMNRLIGDLLDASAINAGKLALDLRRCEVSELLHEACDMFRGSAEQQGLELAPVSIENPLRVVCDRDRILQVLSNLISNAIKYTPNGGSIRVAAVCRDDRIRFEVHDTGAGIPPEHLPHLFEQFWQGQGGRRDSAGLGLYIVRGVLIEHGSDLQVESTVGAGSTFAFELPAAPP